MVGVREERVKGVPIIRAEAPKSITHEDLEARKTCVPEVEAKLAVDMDTRDCFHASYSVGVKVICIFGPTGGVDIL